MSIVVFLLVGMVIGWIASTLVVGHGLGVVGDIVLGIVGSLAGGFLFDVLDVPVRGFWGSFAMSVFGAMAVLATVRLFTSNRPITR